MIQEIVVGSSSVPITKAENVMRCPRCDSSNTKFCYYNNYNLTQPRHFCKSCRRYWTKGGTLRNVPIGGGCRKNKTTTTSTTHVVARAALSTEMLLNGSSGFLGNGLLDPYSDLQTLLTTRFSTPSPSPNPSFFSPLKTEGNMTLGSFLRGNQHPLNGFGFGFGAPDVVQNGGINSSSSNILELYDQRLKSSSGNYNYYGNVMGSAPSSPSPSPSTMNSPIMEASNGGGEHYLGGYGMMGSSLGISGWSDFPQLPINGAFP